MTPTVETTLADHGARLTAVEDQQRGQGKSIDSIRNWIMATQATAILCLLGIVVGLLKK